MHKCIFGKYMQKLNLIIIIFYTHNEYWIVIDYFFIMPSGTLTLEECNDDFYCHHVILNLKMIRDRFLLKKPISQLQHSN